MVLEEIKPEYVERRPYYAFLFGFAYVIIAYLTSFVFFPTTISVAILFLITLLLVPTVIRLMAIEERRERSDALQYFIRDHRDIFEIYIFLFLGVFVGFLILGLVVSLGIFNYQMNFLEKQEGLSSELVKNRLSDGLKGDFKSFLGLLENNLFVAIVAFILSFFYGAGAMFLIVLNASIFSTFITFVINNVSNAVGKITIFGIFLVHMIPELAGFLFAAIAGGVVSKALLQERFGSERYMNVSKDSTFILLIAIILIILAAFLETYATTALVNWII